MKLLMLSLSSSLLFADNGDGDGWADGDAGEMALEGCDVDSDGEPWMLSAILVSDALRINFPWPSPFFCLNFSSQLELLVFKCASAVSFMVVANKRAFSLMSASVNAMPDLWALRI
jgi:hypothetical protein